MTNRKDGVSVTQTLATDTLANGNDIDLVRTTAPDDINYWDAEWYWLVQIITPKGEYTKSYIYTDPSEAYLCYSRYTNASDAYVKSVSND
jgi:carbohydrate-selective porin OprB